MANQNPKPPLSDERWPSAVKLFNDMRDALKTAQETRYAQKEYFAHRNQGNLQKSKRLEKKLDTMLHKLLGDPNKQINLFR